MVDQEILEGLRFALARGESLQQAMYSFYNAGYERGKIEEAARALVYMGKEREPVTKRVFPMGEQYAETKPSAITGMGRQEGVRQIIPSIKSQIQPLKPSPKVSPKTEGIKPKVQKPVIKKGLFGKPKPVKPAPIKPAKIKPVERVSRYGEKVKRPRKKVIVRILIITLILLLGILAAVIIFRDELINLFNNLLQNV